MTLDRFKSQRDIAIYWFNKASDLRGSAAALWVSQADEISDVVVARCDLGASFRLDAAVPAVYRMLAGMALELLYKAVIVAMGEDVPHTHTLVELAGRAGFAPSDDDRALLKILTEAIVWDGRYPVPKAYEHFERLRDLETEHLFESRPLGERFKVLTPNHALGWKGFDGLWLRAAAVFWENYVPV